MKLSTDVQTALSLETAYQLVMIAALLELLLLASLMPRSPDAGAPLCFAAVAGLRFAALLALAGLLATQRSTVKPVIGLIALSVWGAMLAPPELWAAALEFRSGLPATLVSSIALSLGLYAALRLRPVIGWGFLALTFSALAMQDWRLEPLGWALGAVITLGVGLWLLELWLIALRTSRLQRGASA